MMKVVAEGLEVNKIAEYESLYGEGEKGELRLYVDRQLSENEIASLETQICNQGVTLVEPISQEAHILFVRFQKLLVPLAIIVAAIAAIGVGVAGWQLLKEPLFGVPWWVWMIGAGVLTYMIVKRK